LLARKKTVKKGIGEQRKEEVSMGAANRGQSAEGKKSTKVFVFFFQVYRQKGGEEYLQRNASKLCQAKNVRSVEWESEK